LRGVSQYFWQGADVALALLLIALCVWTPAPAYADGGAPNLAYISGTTGGVSVLDVGQGKITKTLALDGDPHMIYLSLDGRLLYVTQPALGRVTTIIAATGKIMCSASLAGHPSLLALSQDGSVLYAAANDATSVSAINPATCQVRQTYDTGSPIYGLWVTNGGTLGSKIGQLWASGANAISVFAIQGPLIRTIPVGGGPQYLCIPPVGTTAYVTTRQGSVDIIDLKTWQVRQVLSGGVYGTMDYDALTLDVYVPDTRHSTLDVLAPPSGASLPAEPERVYHTVAPPTAVAVTNDGLFGFVALQGGKVEVFDLIDRDPVYTVTVGGTPHFVITGLYPPTQSEPQATTNTTTPSSPPQNTPGGINPLFIVIAALLILAGIGTLLFLRVARASRSPKH
jgi:DNA-binding beta-propeller fold protein YncE